MGAFEQELYEELAVDEAEGPALTGDELEDLGMEEVAEGFEDEFEEGFEAEGFEDDEFFATEAMDEFDMGDEFTDGYEAYEDDYEGTEEALESVMAYALGAEDADEFFGRLVRGLRQVGSRVLGAVRRAAPTIGRIASGVSRVAGMIPHPYAQAIGRVAGLVGQGANLVQRLRAEGATEEEALEAFAEMAARDPRALPIVAGLTARTVLKSRTAQLSPAARKQAVKQMKGAAKTLVNRRGPAAVRALPKIARSVTRAAAAKGTPPATAVKAVRRTAAKVARNPGMTRKLARSSPLARQRVAQVARIAGARPRSYVMQGPVRITISAA